MKIPLFIKQNYDLLKELYKLADGKTFTVKTIRDDFSLSSGKAGAFLKKTYESNSCIITRTKEATYEYKFND